MAKLELMDDVEIEKKVASIYLILETKRHQLYTTLIAILVISHLGWWLGDFSIASLFYIYLLFVPTGAVLYSMSGIARQLSLLARFEPCKHTSLIRPLMGVSEEVDAHLQRIFKLKRLPNQYEVECIKAYLKVNE